MRAALHFALSCAWLVACAAPTGAQTVYRCSGPAGETVFQQKPCAGGVAVDAKPANIVEGEPSGDRLSRGAIASAAQLRAEPEQADLDGVNQDGR
jgi:hypothetical protein